MRYRTEELGVAVGDMKKEYSNALQEPLNLRYMLIVAFHPLSH